MNKILIFIIAFDLIFVQGCDKTEYLYNPSISSKTGIIMGRVTDNSTGEPIANVGITTQPVTSLIMTDYHGDYMINDVARGTYELTATKQGYLTKSLTVLAYGDTTIANFALDESPLSPGKARIDGTIGGIDWTFYTSSGLCEKLGNDIKISSSFGLGPNTYSVVIYISNPVGIDTLNLGPVTNSYMQYERNLYGSLETYTTHTQSGSGQLEITYFNSTNKTIKGNFDVIMAEVGSSSTKSANGSFKGTWQWRHNLLTDGTYDLDQISEWSLYPLILIFPGSG